MIEVKFQNDTYSLPESWDEVTTPQLETLAQLIQKGVTENELLFRFALYCMGMRMAWRYSVKVNDSECFYIRHGITRVYLVSANQMAVLTSYIQWIVDDNQVKPVITKNPYHELFTSRYRRLIGPADMLANISTSEWILAEIEKAEWANTKNEHHLNRLLAILWRPTAKSHPDGDKRSPFRQETFEQRTAQMAKVKHQKKQVMLWFYQSCLAALANKFPDVFREGEAGDKSPVDSFMQLVTDLAKDDLSKVDKVYISPLYQTLYTLQSIIEKSEKSKENNKNA
jgi:hypothetical protein